MAPQNKVSESENQKDPSCIIFVKNLKTIIVLFR